MSPLRSATLWLFLALGTFASARAESPPAAPSFKVTSRALTSIYIDGGRAQGLRVGDRLRVMADGTPVAELEVVSVADQWATCRTISVTRPIDVGDVVVLVAQPAPAAAPAQPATAPAAPAAAPPTPPGLAAMAPKDVAEPPATPTPAAVPPAVSASSAAPATVTGRSFTVKYRSASNVYLDAGRAAGLNVGDRLRVVAGQATVAELEVVYAAEQSASCKVISETRPVKAGDVALLLVRAATPPAVAGTTEQAAPPAPAATPAAPAAYPSARPPSAPWARLGGGVSVGYYRSWDQSVSALDYSEQTARVDLGLYEIGGQPLSFTLRARSRRDARALLLSDQTPLTESTNRLYELALRYEPRSDRFAFELGRVGIYRFFVGVGYLDGGIVRFRPADNLQLGAFAGRVADVDGLGLQGAGEKYGGFVRLAPGGRYANNAYDVALAFARETAGGDVSREYLSLESRFGGSGRWSLFQRAELDINTGWRQDLTGKSYQLTNVALSGNLRLASSTWAFVSYDGLRNYRYYQNRLLPPEQFDDLLHQGLRAGLNYSRPGGFGATAGFGMSLKQPDPRYPDLDIANAYSFNAGVRHANLFSSGFSAGLDGAAFSNGYTDGGVISVRAGRSFGPAYLLDLSLGRSFYHVQQTGQNRNTQWLRVTGRAGLGRHLYFQGNFEYDGGDDLQGPRVFLELGYLF